MINYKIEVKASNRTVAQIGKWAKPGRIWVRGYDEAGLRVSQEHVGFVDLRSQGPASQFGIMRHLAEKRCQELEKLQKH